MAQQVNFVFAYNLSFKIKSLETYLRDLALSKATLLLHLKSCQSEISLKL